VSEEKRRQLERLNEMVTSPLTVGGAETGLNLSDMYTHFENREEVLAVLQQRFPHELGGMEKLDPQPWFEKVANLHRPESYVSGYAGEVGELKAIDALKHLGIDATQFESKVHRANDLTSSHGVEYSVKSYDPQGLHKFVSLARHTPESTHYVVNEELYHNLKDSGDLASLDHGGIEIINGHFSHVDHVAQAHDVLERISTHQEVSDSVLNNIPIVACVVALASIGIGSYNYSKGFASRSEFAIDIAGTFGRIAAGSGGALAGSVAGAYVGSAAFPILGTLIGGTVGGILGSMGAREAARGAVAWVKWGYALEAFERLGRTYADGLPAGCVDAVTGEILKKRDIERFVKEEKTRAPRFQRELDPHDSTPPTVAAVLWQRSTERAEMSLPKITEAGAKTSDGLLDLCVDSAVARYPRQQRSARESAYKMFGSFLVEVPLLRASLPPDERAQLNPALEEIEKNPNHPFKAHKDKADILAAVAMKALVGGGSAT